MLMVLLGISATSVLAQYDDVYYDPERNNNRTSTDRRQVPAPRTNPAPSQDYSYEEGYDDEEYDYYYTSRLRRFHRPYAGFDYFDPIYVDAYYYDAFARPGATVLIYDDPFGFYGWNSWNRWNRWNGRGFGGWNAWNRWNNFGWNDPFFGWNSPGLSFGFGWNRWNRWNNFGGNGFGWNNFGWNNWNNWGFGGPFWANNWYCPPTWGNNFNYFNINNNFNNFNRGNDLNNRNIYYGPRTGGGAVGTQPGIDNPNGRSPRFTGDPDVKSNPAAPAPRPDYSGGRRLDEAPTYTRDRSVPPSTNPRGTTTEPGRDVYGTPNSTDRYRDARGNVNSNPDYNTRRPENADPFSGGRRPENTNTDRPRTYTTDDRPNMRPGTTPQDNPYNRPRSYETPDRSNSNPRSMDNGNLDRARTYTPDRSYERSRDYSAPRSNPSNSGSSPRTNSGWDSGRSNSGSGWDSGRSNTNSSPRSFDGGGSRPSGGSSSPSGSSSGSSSSGGRSGGRQ